MFDIKLGKEYNANYKTQNIKGSASQLNKLVLKERSYIETQWY